MIGLRILVVGVFALAFTANLSATVSGMATTGGVVQGVEEQATRRQLVRLTGYHGSLSGHPESSVVELITARIPVEAGPVDLILREIELHDGRRTVFVGVPPRLQEKLVRLTLYLDPAIKHPVLLEDTGEHWAPIKAQFIDTGGAAASRTRLNAFVIEHPGTFWLLSGADENAIVPYDAGAVGVTASALVGGGVETGIWHWVWAAIVLASLWLVSVLRHRREVHVEEC